MSMFDILQLVGGSLLAFSYIPQITKTFKLKRVDEISKLFWTVLFIGLCFMEVNALHLISLGTYSYAITESLNVLLSGTFVAQVYYYSKFPGGRKR